MLSLIVTLLTSGLGLWKDYKLKKATSDNERERIKAEHEENVLAIKANLLSKGGWWFQLFFIVPIALWFSAVVIYSIFWCKDCMYPQPWTIARLPDPLNEWVGVVIAYLFLVGGRR